MKLTSKELKRRARGIIIQKYSLLMGTLILSELIVFIISYPFGLPLPNPSAMQITIWILSTVIISLLTSILNTGLMNIHLNLARGKEAKFYDLFLFFFWRPDRFVFAKLRLAGIFILISVPACLVTAVVFLFTPTLIGFVFLTAVCIATMVFTCIISISYSQVFYLLIDKAELSVRNAFQQSRELMKGNKARSFYISLSFLGMLLPGVLSFGIGLLWVMPYINQTRTEFYRNITAEIT